MNSVVTLSPSQLTDFLLNVATVRPVFIWGPPGIGKSALVQKFADDLGLPCVSLLGSQLAAEDIIGVPQIVDGVSRFCPPRMIARTEPYCLFLDELNACSQEVQKAFYSLIHERRIGEYELPKGSIVIGAGNRAQDAAIVKTMSSALINRMVHVHLKTSHRDWDAWAKLNGISPMILEYLHQRPDHLWSAPPKHEEPFSTPRGWHVLSDAINAYGEDISQETLEALAYGVLSPQHAGQFKAFAKLSADKHRLDAIIKGDANWPADPTDRDILYFLAQAFRARLLKALPEERSGMSGDSQAFTHKAKAMIRDIARISLEMAQVVVSEENGERLPAWFMVEVVRDLPRLVEKRE
jgi:MoxR-like ATPase